MSVNRDSQSRVERCSRFTVALLLGLASVLLLPGPARADRVVLLPVTGGPDELVEDVEQQLVVTLRRLGHEPVSDPVPVGTEPPPPPQSAEDFEAIAAMQQADWALHVAVEPGDAGGYWLRLRAGYAPRQRLEALRAEVRRSREADRYRELLGALLRPEGLGADAGRLGGEDAAARAAEAQRDEQPTTETGAEEAPAEDEPQQQEAPAQDEATPDDSPQEPGLHLPYEEPPPRPDDGFYATAGLGLAPIVRHDPRALGGTLGTVGLRMALGKRYDARGMHWRAGVDLVLGDSNGFTLVGGALYDALDLGPFVLGASAELGLHKATSGNDVWQLMGRVGAVARLPLSQKLFVEASLPELTVYSANGGGLTLGGSARVGLAF